MSAKIVSPLTAYSRPMALKRRRTTAGDAPLVKRRRYYLYSFDPETGWTPNAAVPCIDLDMGQLYVNGIQIVAPRITQDHITWHQHAAHPSGTHYLAGHLHIHSSGVEAHGTLFVGTNHADAVRHDVLATAIPTITYATRITTQRYPMGTDPSKIAASGWQDGLKLQISYQQQVGNSVPSPVVTLDDQDISDECSWSVNDRYTVLNIALSDSDCAFAPSLYAQASVSFDALTLNAPGAGVVRKTCSDAGSGDGSVYLLQATQVQTAARAAAPALPHPERKAVAAPQLLATDNAPLTINELMTLLPDDQVNEDANSMLMRNMKWAMGQDDTQRKWLAQFFNEIPPAISDPNQVKLVQQSLSWYQQQFAKAYLTQSFNSYSGPNEPEHRLSSDQADRLTDYLKGGLAQDKDFNVQHQGIYIDAYVGAVERLGAYIQDTTSEVVGWAQGSVVFTRTDTSADLTIPAGLTLQTATGIAYSTQAIGTIAQGKTQSDPVPVAANAVGLDSVVAANMITQFADPQPAGVTAVTNPAATTLSPDSGGMKWAKKLFTALTTGSQFILMVNRVAGAAGDPKALGPVNNFACLLTALDTSGQVARNYFQSVLSGVLVKLVPQVVHRDKDTIMQWLPTAMQELLRRLANGELPEETDISQAEAQEMYQVYLKHSADIASATADLLQSIVQSGLVKQAQQAEEQFAQTIGQRWPALAKAGRFMLALGWIGGVSSVIVSLTKGDWKKMSDIEKAEFVTNCVQLCVTGFEAVPVIYQGVKSVTLSVWNKLNSWWNEPPQQMEIEMQQINIADENTPLIQSESENVQELMEESQATGTLGKGTIFERLFADGVFSGVLKAVGAIAAAAMAGYSLWQLIEDVKNHGSVTTEVFDSLTFAANFLSAVCIIADLFVATSWLPIAGAVLAIAGVIIGILAGFFEKPDNPVDDWMVDYGIPFASSLPAPSSGTSGTAAFRLAGQIA